MPNKKIIDDKDSESSAENDFEITRMPKAKKGKKGKFFDWVDAGLKIVIALVGIWASILGYNYQKTSTASLLLVQQEKGDTEIRAQMFGKITDRLMKPTKGQESLVQDTLLVQMLALNFHELIELKPLMLNLDAKLKRKIAKLTHDFESTDIVKEAQKNIRSVARRIRDRQVATLVRDNDESNNADLHSDAGYFRRVADDFLGGIESIIGIFISDDSDGRRDIGLVQYVNVVTNGVLGEKNSCYVRKVVGKNGCLKEPMELPGLRTNQSMYISVDEANWGDEIFEISIGAGDKKVKPTDADGNVVEGAEIKSCKYKEGDSLITPTKPGSTSFKVSWYDFPYTDNTLLANGDRYTVFIDRVCKDSGGKQNAVRLGILYFPKDYYPSRERPVSYTQLRGKLGMGSEDNMFGH